MSAHRAIGAFLQGFAALVAVVAVCAGRWGMAMPVNTQGDHWYGKAIAAGQMSLMTEHWAPPTYEEIYETLGMKDAAAQQKGVPAPVSWGRLSAGLPFPLDWQSGRDALVFYAFSGVVGPSVVPDVGLRTQTVARIVIDSERNAEPVIESMLEGRPVLSSYWFLDNDARQHLERQHEILKTMLPDAELRRLLRLKRDGADMSKVSTPLREFYCLDSGMTHLGDRVLAEQAAFLAWLGCAKAP